MADRKQQLHTPRAVFKYCHLNKADTRYKEEGEYSVTVALDKDLPSTKTLLKKLDALLSEAAEEGQEKFDSATGQQKAKYKKAKITEPTVNPVCEDEVDDEGDPTGRVLLKFKTKASFKDKKTGEMVQKVVKLVDSFGEVIPRKKRPLVYGGSEGRVAFTTGAVFIPKEADVYLSLYLNEVQIAKLVSGGESSSSFGAMDDADFSADELAEYEGNASSSGEDQDDGGDDGDLDDEIPF